jgi:hypothetical protein
MKIITANQKNPAKRKQGGVGGQNWGKNQPAWRTYTKESSLWIVNFQQLTTGSPWKKDIGKQLLFSTTDFQSNQWSGNLNTPLWLWDKNFVLWFIH